MTDFYYIKFIYICDIYTHYKYIYVIYTLYISIYLYISSKIKHTQTSHSHFSYLLCIMPIYVYGLYNEINFNKFETDVFVKTILVNNVNNLHCHYEIDKNVIIP